MSARLQTFLGGNRQCQGEREYQKKTQDTPDTPDLHGWSRDIPSARTEVEQLEMFERLIKDNLPKDLRLLY